MKTLSIALGSCLLPLFAAALVACGPDAVPAVAAPAATESAAVAPPPPPPPTATAEASAAPSASAAAKPPKVSSGRPMVIKSDAKEVTDTFGSSPGAKLSVGDKEIATLKVPENALRSGTNITFRLDAKAKGFQGLVGKVYQIIPMIPPSTTGSPVDSDGPPFELQMPAGTKKNANLAIGVEDDKGKIKWTIVAPKRIDDATGMAHFELMTLPSAWIHVTTKPPTDAK